jgi:HEPN domain-containing protein
MTDFTKTKMMFAVGLLGAMFMLQPLLQDVGRAGFVFLGMMIELRYMYYAFSVLLGLAVYFFAMEVVSGRRTLIPQRAGNVMYALALLVPPAYASIGLIASVGYAVRPVVESKRAVAGIELALLATAGLLGAGVFFILKRRLAEEDKSHTVSRLASEETTQMSRANGLYEAGLYDLVVVESFLAIETALRKLLLAKDIPAHKPAMKDLLVIVENRGLLSTEELDHIRDLRVLRNEILHEAKNTNRSTAERVIETSRRTITRIDKMIADGVETNDEQEKKAATA